MRHRFAAAVVTIAVVAVVGGVAGSVAAAGPAQVAAGSGDYNLTSMCKPDASHGRLRVRNQTNTAQPYTLALYGTQTVLAGTAAANADLFVDVDWTASNNTWILGIGGFSYTKAIGNNPLCVTPSPTTTPTPSPTPSPTVSPDPTSTPTPIPSPTTTTPGPVDLPDTGTSVGGLLMIGSSLVLVGAAVLVIGRRVRRAP